MQRHLISRTAAPGTTLAAMLGHAAVALIRSCVHTPLAPRLQRDIGLIDTLPAEERDSGAGRAAEMQLLRNI